MIVTNTSNVLYIFLFIKTRKLNITTVFFNIASRNFLQEFLYNCIITCKSDFQTSRHYLNLICMSSTLDTYLFVPECFCC